MTAVERYLLVVDRDRTKAEAIASSTAKELVKKEITLIELVQALGESINSEDEPRRGKAIQFLALVIGSLPSDFLSRQQIEVLCRFLCDRITDGGAIGGLQTLQGMLRYNGDLAIMTLRAITTGLQDLSLRPQAQRMQVLALISNLMAKHRKALKTLGDEVTEGIPTVISGEKDPRNLMTVFSILHVIMVEWDISKFAELLLDSVFCYFPITFRPPPNDPHGISAQDLKDRLKECVASSAHFAPYVFPQLLDKLDTTSMNVKRDVLQCLAACSESYGPRTMANYSNTVWESVKPELFAIQEEDLAEEALRVLHSITLCLGRAATSNDPKTDLANFMRPIVKECIAQIQEPEHKQARFIGRVLCSMGTASPIAINNLIRTFLPVLLTVYKSADSVSKQRALMETLLQLLNANLVVFGSTSSASPPLGLDNALGEYKEQLFQFVSQALMSTSVDEVSFRVTAMKALLCLCLLRKFLQENELGMAVQYLDEIVMTEDPMGRDSLRKEAISTLVEISRVKPDMIMNITFPALMARLPDGENSSEHDYLITLEALAQISIDKFVADTLVRRLLARLDTTLSLAGSSGYSQALLASIHYILAHRNLKDDANLQFYLEKIVIGLVKRSSEASMTVDDKNPLTDRSTMEVLARLCLLIILALDEHQRKSLSSQVYTLFGEVESDGFEPVLFRKDALPVIQKRTLIFSTALMAGLPVDAPVELFVQGKSEVDLFDELIRLCLDEQDAGIRASLLRQLAMLVNKFSPDSGLDAMTSKFVSLATSLSDKATEEKVRTIFWLAKALLLRLAPTTTQIIDCLLEMLSHQDYGALCARGFALLLAPDEIVCRANGARIRLLANQRCCATCIPKLAIQFGKMSEPSTKTSHLVALSGLLEYAPMDVLMQDIDALLPLLLQSIDIEADKVSPGGSGNASIQAATINTLTTICKERPEVVEEHLGSLVAKLLRVACDAGRSVDAARYSALRCLRIFPAHIKKSALMPVRWQVTSGLVIALGDPRRVVRREAVDCRAVWLLIDEPESD